MPFAGSAREGHAGTLLQLLQQQQQHQGLAAGKVSGAGGLWEPTSVLDHRHSPSPSPPNSVSTLSSPLGAATAGVAALAGASAKNVSPPPPAAAWPGGAAGEDAAAGGKEEWHLTPLDMSLGAGEGWDAAGAVLSDGAAPPGLAPDHTFLRWIIGGEDASAAMGAVMDPPVLELEHAPSMMSPAFGPNMPFAPAMEDTKVAPFGHASNLLLHHHQHHPQPHAAFFGSHPSFDAAPPAPKRHHPMAGAPAPKLPSFPGPASPAGGFVPTMKPKAEAGNDEAAAAMEQLAEAAKLAEAGDAFGAREILARLNYRLPAAPAAGMPLLRSAFYFKEALRLALSPTGEAPARPVSTPYDVVLKLGAYKAFSEVSPVLQFAHLTCVQAVLDELGGAGRIHVLDFDIGMGEQWASLMQELAQRCPAATLKVTALVSSASHHHLELQLIHENLSGFAAELGVFLQFAAFNIDTLDSAELVAITSGDAVAVHLPVGSAHVAAMPAILRLVKRLGAKVVVSVDHGCDRTELPFAAHLFQAFQSCVSLLDSIDAVGSDADAVAKIERFLVQPGVEQRVVARHGAAAMGKTPLPWRTVFASSGFVPVQASTFAESQAEALLKRMALMGFRVEKRGGALCLYWQRSELVSVSAWRC
ncbi:Scarecrow-like protein 6 [Dichanthelium oligosanthes]|uniref:Scarecrow-like protein 6 n=1 Tax=Dichanthelium oligosanthes TaxID=888268 RepID=A0A1E5VUT0_9POAL|nr:Scarecrow-like protein 6 [Dichanthelium oligosanthes]